MTAPAPLPELIPTGRGLPRLVVAAGPRAATCVLEFFAASLRNGVILR